MARTELTLRAVLQLITKDVKRLKKKLVDNTDSLHPSDAATLSRYASALSGIAEEEERTKNKEKQRLEKMSTEDLLKLYQEQNKK